MFRSRTSSGSIVAAAILALCAAVLALAQDAPAPAAPAPAEQPAPAAAPAPDATPAPPAATATDPAPAAPAPAGPAPATPAEMGSVPISPPAEPAPFEGPRLPDEVENWATFAGQVIRMLAVLGAICGLGWLSMKVLGPRMGALATKRGDLIRVIETKRLDPKTTLYLVEIAGKPTLIGVSEHEVRSLAPLELDEERIREALELRSQGGVRPAASAPGDGAKVPGAPRGFARVLSEKIASRKEG